MSLSTDESTVADATVVYNCVVVRPWKVKYISRASSNKVQCQHGRRRLECHIFLLYAGASSRASCGYFPMIMILNSSPLMRCGR